VEIIPKVPALLFFPENEPSLDVDELMGVLIKKKNVKMEKYPAAHGFCDPNSSHYNEALATKAFDRMLEFIRGIG
jgi:dienelactone hydrolase